MLHYCPTAPMHWTPLHFSGSSPGGLTCKTPLFCDSDIDSTHRVYTGVLQCSTVPRTQATLPASMAHISVDDHCVKLVPGDYNVSTLIGMINKQIESQTTSNVVLSYDSGGRVRVSTSQASQDVVFSDLLADMLGFPSTIVSLNTSCTVAPQAVDLYGPRSVGLFLSQPNSSRCDQLLHVVALVGKLTFYENSQLTGTTRTFVLSNGHDIQLAIKYQTICSRAWHAYDTQGQRSTATVNIAC